MSHIEFLENLIAEYRAEFEADPSDDPEVSAFRAGMLFAWKFAIERLKHPDDAVF